MSIKNYPTETTNTLHYFSYQKNKPIHVSFSNGGSISEQSGGIPHLTSQARTNTLLHSNFWIDKNKQFLNDFLGSITPLGMLLGRNSQKRFLGLYLPCVQGRRKILKIYRGNHYYMTLGYPLFLPNRGQYRTQICFRFQINCYWKSRYTQSNKKMTIVGSNKVIWLLGTAV